MVGQRVAGAGRPGAPGRRRRRRRARGRAPPARARRARRRRARAGRPPRPGRERLDHRLDRAGRDHPRPDGRRPALAGQRLELVGVDPAPLGDDPVDATAIRAAPSTPAAPARRRAPRRRRPSRPGRSRAARSGRRAAAAAASAGGGARSPSRPGAMAVGAEHPQPSPGARPSRCRRRRRRAADTSWSRAASTVSEASKRTVGRHCPGATTASPRATSSCSTPTRLSATRWPGPMRSTRGSLRLWMRPDAGRPGAGPDDDAGRRRPSAPPVSVPVTTVPAALGGERRGRPTAAGRPRSAAAGVRGDQLVEARPGARRARRPSAPSTGTIGAPARNVPATWSATSSAASSQPLVVDQVDLGERDDAVAARRAARGCAGAPRTAASSPRWRRPRTGRRRRAPTPASMFLRNRTWPGTSTKLIAAPDGSVGVGEAEVDGEAPALLLREAVGVGAGERQDERRLAVVDVAGGGDDAHRARRAAGRPAPSASVASSPGSTVRRSRHGAARR